MKLDIIKRPHIIEAAKLIDKQGIPNNYIWSQYYIIVNGVEYPFKYLVSLAIENATKEHVKFQSNESYRNYITSLGFKLSYYKEGYNFFTKKELDFYVSIHNKDYRKDNIKQKNYGQKLRPINLKLKYWLEQIKPEGFEIRFDGKWLGVNSKVSPYLWPRIYHGEDKDVFFNVEVSANVQCIGIKLDGYYKTTKKLPDYKIEILEQFKKNSQNNWWWLQIPFNELDEYNWDRLFLESRQYIQGQLNNHNRLKKILSVEKKIARITWNSNQWMKPSGRKGKSENPSFELKYGFGHEEWLFDGDKIIDGFKYGFLEPIHKFRSKYEGKLFDISLYTRNNETKKRFWVTTLKNVEVITSEESEKVLKRYKEEGWYDEMKSDLYNLNLDSKQLDKWVKDDTSLLFNIKFDALQIHNVSDNLIPIIESEDITSNRYNLMDIPYSLQQKYEDRSKTGFSFEDSGDINADLEEKSSRKGSGKEIELDLKHNILQKLFLKYLQKKYGEEIVKRECKAHGASRIDITRKTNTGYIFYEIKTYNSLRTSIRESIGQLLEYSLYPNVQESEKITLVSHVAPTKAQIEYLKHLKTFLKIPFSYIHFDTDIEEIVTEI